MMTLITRTFLNSYSQVMLQKNQVTGFLFLVGIAVNSWTMTIGSIIGLLIGVLTAKLLKYPLKDIEEGIYGFNGILVAIASIFYLGFNYGPLIAIIPFVFLSTVLTHWFIKLKISPLTAPFVVSSWLLLGVYNAFSPEIVRPIITPESSLDILNALGNGIGQVMFQENVLTGVFFLLGLLLSSWEVALFGLLGSLTGALIASALDLPLLSINAGFYGYNAVLCGVAFAGKKARSFVLALLTISISLLMTILMKPLPLAMLTAPFVLSTWGVHFVLNLRKEHVTPRVH